MTDETITTYHYYLDCERWVEDCSQEEQREDGSCPVGTTCFGAWGPCECGCQAGSWDECGCLLCERRTETTA